MGEQDQKLTHYSTTTENCQKCPDFLRYHQIRLTNHALPTLYRFNKILRIPQPTATLKCPFCTTLPFNPPETIEHLYGGTPLRQSCLITESIRKKIATTFNAHYLTTKNNN